MNELNSRLNQQINDTKKLQHTISSMEDKIANQSKSISRHEEEKTRLINERSSQLALVKQQLDAAERQRNEMQARLNDLSRPRGGGGGGGCFPSDAIVYVKNKGLIRMDNLNYGDEILIITPQGRLIYRSIYLFGHKEVDVNSRFISIRTTNKNILKLSPTHYIRVIKSLKYQYLLDSNNLNNSQFVMNSEYIYANDVKVGDIVLTLNSSYDPNSNENNSNQEYISFQKVISTSIIFEKGLFNPFVRGGDIIANGIAASTHSEWIFDKFCQNEKVVFLQRFLPYVYDVILTPVYLTTLLIGWKNSELIAVSLQVHKGEDSKYDIFKLGLIYIFLTLAILTPIMFLTFAFNEV